MFEGILYEGDVEHMAQQAAQFLDGNLCLVAVESDEGIYVVEGIEQEMRIQLVAQVLQLCFRTTFFGFTAGTFLSNGCSCGWRQPSRP